MGGFASRLRDGRQLLGVIGGPHQCPICLQRFPTTQALGSHRSNVHGDRAVAGAAPGAIIAAPLIPRDLVHGIVSEGGQRVTSLAALHG